MAKGHPENAGYIPGDHWTTCQRCGFDRRSSDMAKEWTGLVVCRDTCWESRHPQDFVRAIKEDTSAKGLVTGRISDENVVNRAETLLLTEATYLYTGAAITLTTVPVINEINMPGMGYLTIEAGTEINLPELGYITE